MTNQIVQVAVSQQIASAPNTLQRTGSFVSQGGTLNSPGTKSLLTQLSDLTPLLNGSKALTSISQTAGLATGTATSMHGFAIGDTLLLTIAGAAQAAYNGVQLVTVTTTTAFTFAVPSGTTSPATGTLIYTVEDVSELLAMATTFFARGQSTSVYVLECGAGNANDGVAFLSAWITANPKTIYSWLVPRYWDGNSNYLSLIASFESTIGLTYFFTTTTLASYQAYTNLMKDVFSLIESPLTAAYPANVLTAIAWSANIVTAATTTAHGVSPGDWFTIIGVTPSGYNGTFLALPGTTGSSILYALGANPGAESVLGSLQGSYYAQPGIPALEFSAASAFWTTLNYQPSTNNRVTPTAFSFLSGVTPFPTPGNSSTLTALKAAATNYVGTGAEGGISNAILMWGTTEDGRDFTYWYSVDWVQININLNLTNEIINGSNNAVNPLYYDQAGINRLQARLAQTMNTAVGYGLALGQVILVNLPQADFVANLNAGAYLGQIAINAVPFGNYTSVNPSDFANGVYNGLSVVYTPNRGFIQILVGVVVTDFI